MNDVQIGRSFRALRQRRRYRQTDVAVLADLAQTTVSKVERGHVETLSLRALRRLAGSLDARVDVSVSWQGAGLDRLLDRHHADLSGRALTLLEKFGWDATAEVSFSHFGDRGSIDLLAVNGGAAAVLVVEIKTELVSVEDTLRRLDVKARIAPLLIAGRLGHRPRAVGRLLVMPEASTARRQVQRHERLLRSALPDTRRTFELWLRSPTGTFAGIMFLSPSPAHAGRRASTTIRRVRRAAMSRASHGRSGNATATTARPADFRR